MALKNEKIVVLAPIPNASDNTATIVSTRSRKSSRKPNRKSCSRSRMEAPHGRRKTVLLVVTGSRLRMRKICASCRPIRHRYADAAVMTQLMPVFFEKKCPLLQFPFPKPDSVAGRDRHNASAGSAGPAPLWRLCDPNRKDSRKKML
jgi:hypothetical protein